MTAPALVIQGSLVDAKNVSTHKVVRLSIDVPAELGAQIVKTFGWPTMAEPVAVAVARLNGTVKAEAEEYAEVMEKWKPEHQQPVEAPKERLKFSRLRPSAQAVLYCKKVTFWRWLREQTSSLMVNSEADAAIILRDQLGIESRSELDRDESLAVKWFSLRDKYDAWMAAV